jgi:hypothetical protein
MKKLISTFTLTLVMITSHAQNLVPNASFESYTNAYCGIQSSPLSNTIMNDWISPTAGTPQVYFTNIATTCYNFQPFSQYTGPIGIKGNQTPRTGDVMLGLYCFTIPNFNQRHYIQTELDVPMTVGSVYVVEFYASLADSIESASDNLGAYLSVTAPSSSDDQVLNNTPQVFSSAPIDEVTDWVLISDTIVAQEAYSYLTIGNFFDDNSTTSLVNPSASGGVGTYGTFYFVDDVRIEEISGVGLSTIQGNDLSIYPTYVTDQLNIELLTGSLVEVVNVQGQVVYSEFLEIGIKTLDVSGLSQGVYTVSVQNGSKRMTRKIVK